MIQFYKAYFIYLAVFSYFAVVLILSLLPGNYQTYDAITLADKVKHMLAYGGAAIMLEGFYLTKKTRARLLVGLFVLSGAIELIQPLVGRDASWLDLLANGIGLTIGWLLMRALNRGRPR